MHIGITWPIRKSLPTPLCEGLREIEVAVTKLAAESVDCLLLREKVALRNMASKLLLLFVIVVTFSDALAIQCYQCDSSKNVACDFGILSFAQPVADCQASDGSLMGIVSSIIPQNCYKLSGITTDGKSYTARGCAVNTYVNTCDALAKTIQFANQEKIQSLECWTCNTDKCNSATALSGMTIAAVLAACFLFLF